MKARKALAAALVLAAAGAVAWVAERKLSKPRGTGPRPVVARSEAIEETVDSTGAVAPLNRVEIKPPIAGRVERLLADEGDRVGAGRILAWMSSSDRAAILDAARARGPEELKRWEDAYKPTPIVAPLSGVVIVRNAVVGQTVDAGTALFAISDTLVVVAQVDESDIGRVRAGMPARITLDAYPDHVVDGEVFDILYEGKNVSNVIQYGVKVRISKMPSFFRSQMTANVGFILRRKENAVVLPAAAVRDGPDGAKTVLVRGPGGEPVQRTVTTGIESGEKIEILSGVAPGEEVLLGKGRYAPQQAPRSSPLTFGGRPGAPNAGQAPRPRRGGNGAH